METLIEQKIKAILPIQNGISFTLLEGGYVNKSYCIHSGNKKLFCKINSATKFPQLLSKEKSSLEFISKHAIIKTPGIFDLFEIGGYQVLILEWISEGELTQVFWKKFGEQLALLHLISNDYFGREEDNYMGNIPQTNHPSNNWNEFFIHQRLEPLVKRCRDQNFFNSKHISQFEKIYALLPEFFDPTEKPSLLHGDLWKGNIMCNENSEPVLIDPSVYFGHRSIDLGMISLQNTVDQCFYEAYNFHFPLSPNHKAQWEITNLYPLLVSLFLFGKAQLPTVEFTLNRFT